ncbi:hypothetical protein ACWFRC_21010 [Bacillus cereus]
MNRIALFVCTALVDSQYYCLITKNRYVHDMPLKGYFLNMNKRMGYLYVN